ncbi:RDD family protein [Cellulophaga sp. F20128]|uniref:RDD family protein n=1 Tax=Cellulophaga sp. F20128 TaxID=2926413 RepID=UPI001FF4BC75|nr:RDD family protein [Cellulophaga sp. F20128]MCK0158063.1 RDD family protein [Cellulophaga sp. F20128]
MKEINKGTRIVNVVIDMIVVSFIAAMLSLILDNMVSSPFIFISVWMAYYFVFEFFTGRTPGKLITNTLVVDLENGKPSAKRIAIRTLLRLNPLDGISYLFGRVQGTHDVLSKTKLVLKKKNDASL